MTNGSIVSRDRRTIIDFAGRMIVLADTRSAGLAYCEKAGIRVPRSRDEAD